MPVGTRGAVRLLDAADLDDLGARGRPGQHLPPDAAPGRRDRRRPRRPAPLHRAATATCSPTPAASRSSPSAPQVDDDGVTFRSTYDGSTHRLTPEAAVRIQELLGADIQMVLDVCPALPAPERRWCAPPWTARWRGRPGPGTCHRRRDQALFGIVQGGVDPDCGPRARPATVALDFDGYGIGGLSVGEPLEQMLPALAAAIAELPADRPRYLMGVGDPVSMVEAVALGVDMFDCVLPTRLARHGTALTGAGRQLEARAATPSTTGPLDPGCAVPGLRPLEPRLPAPPARGRRADRRAAAQHPQHRLAAGSPAPLRRSRGRGDPRSPEGRRRRPVGTVRPGRTRSEAPVRGRGPRDGPRRAAGLGTVSRSLAPGSGPDLPMTILLTLAAARSHVHHRHRGSSSGSSVFTIVFLLLIVGRRLLLDHPAPPGADAAAASPQVGHRSSVGAEVMSVGGIMGTVVGHRPTPRSRRGGRRVVVTFVKRAINARRRQRPGAPAGGRRDRG